MTPQRLFALIAATALLATCSNAAGPAQGLHNFRRQLHRTTLMLKGSRK
jgi:hypothetical protein